MALETRLEHGEHASPLHDIAAVDLDVVDNALDRGAHGDGLARLDQALELRRSHRRRRCEYAPSNYQQHRGNDAFQNHLIMPPDGFYSSWPEKASAVSSCSSRRSRSFRIC